MHLLIMLYIFIAPQLQICPNYFIIQSYYFHSSLFFSNQQACITLSDIHSLETELVFSFPEILLQLLLLSLLSFSSMTASLPFIRSPDCLPYHFPAPTFRLLRPAAAAEAEAPRCLCCLFFGPGAAMLLQLLRQILPTRGSLSQSPALSHWTKPLPAFPHWLAYCREGLLPLPSRWFKGKELVQPRYYFAGGGSGSWRC